MKRKSSKQSWVGQFETRLSLLKYTRPAFLIFCSYKKIWKSWWWISFSYRFFFLNISLLFLTVRVLPKAAKSNSWTMTTTITAAAIVRKRNKVWQLILFVYLALVFVLMQWKKEIFRNFFGRFHCFVFWWVHYQLWECVWRVYIRVSVIEWEKEQTTRK